MKILSIEPFVPSGDNFKDSKQLFQELGFKINWDNGDYIGFQKDECRFILQNFSNKEFAQNFMLSVKIVDIREFIDDISKKQLAEKYSISVGPLIIQPYGKEITIIDLAGVCWHFVEQ